MHATVATSTCATSSITNTHTFAKGAEAPDPIYGVVSTATVLNNIIYGVDIGYKGVVTEVEQINWPSTE